jgi:hypothetical protein
MTSKERKRIKACIENGSQLLQLKSDDLQEAGKAFEEIYKCYWADFKKWFYYEKTQNKLIAFEVEDIYHDTMHTIWKNIRNGKISILKNTVIFGGSSYGKNILWNALKKERRNHRIDAAEYILYGNKLSQLEAALRDELDQIFPTKIKETGYPCEVLLTAKFYEKQSYKQMAQNYPDVVANFCAEISDPIKRMEKSFKQCLDKLKNLMAGYKYK